MTRDFGMDLKYGFRTLVRKPAFTFVAILTLALGIGANTALFSILYAVLWKPFPYHEPERLVLVWEADYARNEIYNTVNPANFFDWKQQNKVFTDMAYFAGGSANLNADNRPEEISLQLVSSNFFSVLGTNPLYGRTFMASDDSHEERIIVLSHGLWRRRFGQDKNVIGKKVFLNGRAATVIGVMPEDFQWHFRQGSLSGKRPDLWVRWVVPPQDRIRRGRFLSTFARLKPGISVEQALADMKNLSKQLERQYYESNAGWSSNVVPVREQTAGELRKPLFILSGAVSLVLLIACSNVANLLLSRAVSRAREISVRSALGAGRIRIIRQLLTESVLLSVCGGIIGMFIAVWGTNALTLLAARAGIELGAVAINWQMLLFAFSLSVGTGLFFGVVPAFAISRSNLNEQLKEGVRGTTSESGNLRNLLVVSQLAITVVLLTGAALLIQSYWRLSSIDPGFKSEKILTFRILLPELKYPEDSHRITWFQNLAERLRNVPGIRSVGMVNFLPFAGPSAGTGFHISGKPKPTPDQEPITNVFVVDDGYFRTLQIPLKRGRLFSQDEMAQRKHVVVVNEALVQKYFPNEDPLGKRITIFMRDDDNVPSQIIGIVGNVKHGSIDEQAFASVYWPHPELAYSFMNLVIRTEKDPQNFAPLAIAIVRDLDREIPVADIRTLEDWVDDSTARARFHTVLLIFLASIALILALAGVYGVISYSVAQRTQEMGIRMALGANGGNIFRLVLKHGSLLIVFGIVIGSAIAFAVTRLMRAMLYETSTTDPMIFLAAIVFLVMTALLACSIPSLRASKVDPLVALRYE